MTSTTFLELLEETPPPIVVTGQDHRPPQKSNVQQNPESVGYWLSFYEDVLNFQIDDSDGRYEPSHFVGPAAYNERDVSYYFSRNVIEPLCSIDGVSFTFEFHIQRGFIDIAIQRQLEPVLPGEVKYPTDRMDQLVDLVDQFQREQANIQQIQQTIQQIQDQMQLFEQRPLTEPQALVYSMLDATRTVRLAELEGNNENLESGYFVARPLRQLYGYMKLGGFRYGFLTTYNKTWFVRRNILNPSSLDISFPIRFDAQNPSLKRCIWYLINQQDFSIPPDPFNNQPFDSDSDRHGPSSGEDSENPPSSPHSEFNQSLPANLPPRHSLPRQVKRQRNDQFEEIDSQSLEILDGETRKVGSFYVSTGAYKSKPCSIINFVCIGDLEAWLNGYHQVESLHSKCIPRVTIAGKWQGKTIAIVEPVEPVDVAELNVSEKVKFLNALREIHRLQKTLRVQANHLVKSENGDAMFLDVSWLKATRQKSHQNADAEHLQKLLFEPSGKV